jgi:hypothetical protein
VLCLARPASKSSWTWDCRRAPIIPCYAWLTVPNLFVQCMWFKLSTCFLRPELWYVLHRGLLGEQPWISMSFSGRQCFLPVVTTLCRGDEVLNKSSNLEWSCGAHANIQLLLYSCYFIYLFILLC